MKKSKNGSKRGVTAAAVIAGLTCATALIAPGCNINGSVYGPPPTDDTSYETSANINEDVYGPPVAGDEAPDQ